MNLNFTDTKFEYTYIILLAKITFKYCNNPDGRIYTIIENANGSSYEIVRKLILELNPFIMNRKNVIILNLLVNPYFNELCLFIKHEKCFSKARLKIIKKYIFDYLAEDEVYNTYLTCNLEGKEIYLGKNMYGISKEMLKIL